VRRRLALAALLLAACGNAPGSARPSAVPSVGPGGAAPSTAASPSRELLFAALEPGGDVTEMRNNVVAIVRLDGTAKAKTTFKARQLPQIRVAVPLPQPEARVAAGKVFFADGAGVVRSLAPDGTVSEVTSFGLTSPQQLLSFAVSPDGSRLMGAVFAFPPLRSPPPLTPADPIFGAGDFSLDLFSAAAGQPPTAAQHRTWPQSTGIPHDALSLVGWSASGPLATVDTALGTQQGTQGRQIFGRVAEIDQSGKPGLMVGGSDCQAWAVLPDETALCDDGAYQRVSVRARGGGILFQLPPAANSQYVNLTLAPDGSKLTYRDVSSGRTFVAASDGSKVQLPAGFQPQGWLTPTLLIGAFVRQQGAGNLVLLRLGNPSRTEDLGFKGFFAGVVQGA
jgi:hypothetical protein